MVYTIISTGQCDTAGHVLCDAYADYELILSSGRYTVALYLIVNRLLDTDYVKERSASGERSRHSASEYREFVRGVL